MEPNEDGVKEKATQTQQWQHFSSGLSKPPSKASCRDRGLMRLAFLTEQTIKYHDSLNVRGVLSRPAAALTLSLWFLPW